ncbi:ABC transporter permease subunit [Nocardioides convexus]|uniref:ABC transporter permease subunit n=1 Tax=Nocardioides convexus TaxID=2712224 RepID=UPI0024183AF0|nr:ABC transporter permease subunit [Nocardioides convexus]
MTEVGGRFARIVRTVVEAMTALPSIVAGLFIYAVLILTLDVPPSGFAAGMAISVMMLPIIARASDVVLRVVPGTLREASLALGASRWRTVWHVVLPTARPGLATAVILGVARGIGETSPVLLTSGAANFMVSNPFGGAMNSLPLYIYNGARSGEPALIDRAFGAAAVLMLLVLVLFVIARLIARPAGNRSGPGLLKRAARALTAPLNNRSRLMMSARRTTLAILAAVGLLTVLTGPAGTSATGAPAQRAAAYATIEGKGSTWSKPMVDKWIGDVDSKGMKVVYSGVGSSAGRKAFADGTVDYAISEIPYQGNDEKSGQADKSDRPYAYLPIVAGGTSFTYQAQDRQPAGPQPAPVRRDDHQDLHQPDHQLVRRRDQQGQQRPEVPQPADHPPSSAPTAPAPRPSSPAGWTPSTPRSGAPTSASPASRRTSPRRATRPRRPARTR